jgi:hypothetical protein
MSKCPNCGAAMSCGCQKRVSPTGTVGCSKCINPMKQANTNPPIHQPIKYK